MDRSWARAGRDPARLPAIAAAALRELDARALPDPIAIAGRCAADGGLPRQLPVDFGDAQVTVWRGEHLLVQLIYWLDETTPVHQHGFPGAFRVVRGASLHATYRFESREALQQEVRFLRLVILADHRDGCAYAALQATCSWGEEHLLGVVVHRDEAIAVGGAELFHGRGWNPPGEPRRSKRWDW